MAVRAPKYMTKHEINEILNKKSSWIEKHWKIMVVRNQVLEQLEPYTESEIKSMVEKAKIIFQLGTYTFSKSVRPQLLQ